MTITINLITTDQFDSALEGIIDGMTGAQILATEGVYEILSEALNNDVIDLITQDES